MAVTKPTPENTLLVRIDLGVNMKHNLEAAAEKSLHIAQQKWGLNLPSADIDRILHHSRAQLLRHVSDDARTEWDGGRVVNVIVTAPKAGEVLLPDPKMSTDLKTTLLKTKQGWEINEEENDNAVRVTEFAEHYRSRILTMQDTAIFYGVGSYSTYSDSRNYRVSQ